MNIFKSISNRIKITHYGRLARMAIAEAQKHVADPDDTEFKYWALLALGYLKKQCEIMRQ